MDLVAVLRAAGQSKALKENGDEALVYACFAVIFLFAAKCGFSDLKFSAIITLGAAVQCLGFCLLRLKVRKQNGVKGISSRSLQLFLVVYACRLYSTLQYKGYLPVDRSGDWAYQACEVVAFCVTLSVLVSMHGIHDATYEREHDTCGILAFLAAGLVLAFLVHPSLNNRAVPDIAWTCALYLESIAMIPQLYMMSKKGGVVESFAGHFIACVFFSRLLNIAFWLHSYPELRAKGAEFNLPGFFVLGAQLFQVVLFGDFMCYYARSVRTASSLVLPDPLAV